MRIYLATYADDRMTISADRLMISAQKMGVHSVLMGTPESLPEDFKKKMAPVLAADRGAGWYCWKPCVIAETMKLSKDGDIVVWSDAGSEFIQPIQYLIQAMDEDVLMFSNGWRHVEWCKMDLIKYCFPSYGTPQGGANGTDQLINSAKQVQASHIVFKVSAETRRFVDHWLDLAMRHHLVDNGPSAHDNVPTFQEHRWDQAILCCLQLMYGYKLHWFPSTTGYHIKDQHPGDNYPAMFLHHRKRNHEWDNK